MLENPRPYDVTTLFTVSSGCDDCTGVYNEFIGVQYSYRHAKKDSFFGVVYFSQEQNVREIFLMHGLKTVPHICTSKQVQKRDTSVDFYRTEDVWFIKKDDVHDTQVQLDFINKRLNHEVEMKMPFTTILTKNIILFSVLALFMTVLIKLRPALIEPTLWYVIAVFGYIVCTSGFIYSELHGMPMFRFDKDAYGTMYISEYFMRQQRSQYGGEGYIVSIIAFLTSMFFLAFTRLEVIVDVTGDKRKVILIVLMICAYLGVEFYLLCYKIKTPWYGTTFYPPAEYMRGPLARDQGTNI